MSMTQVERQPVHRVPGHRARDAGRMSLYVASGLIAAGLLLRLPIIFYHGDPNQVAFNNYLFHYLGGYSDVASLYFRDHLVAHPAPYFDYRFEYPVVTGAFVWLMGFVHGSVVSYMIATALVLSGCGLAVVWLTRKFEDSNVWILALAPALATEVILNWDIFGLLLTITALLLFLRNRDAWGGATLALAVWAKLFPAVILPLVVVLRVRQRQWRELAHGLVAFGAVSLLVNAAVAWQHGPHGWVVRRNWVYFFQFNQHRRGGLDIWSFFDEANIRFPTHQINAFSGVLLLSWILIVLAVVYRTSAHRSARTLLPPACLSLIAWFFFINKIYSPQYGLWVIVFLAVVGAPLRLAVPFLVLDLVYFLASFHAFQISSTSGDSYYHYVLLPAAGVRELLLLGIAIWGLWAVRSQRGPAVAQPA
jgi:hypothetical protein